MVKLKEKLKTGSTEMKEPLVEIKIVTNIILYITESWFLPVFTENATAFERNKKKKLAKFKNSPIFSLKKYIFKVLSDISYQLKKRLCSIESSKNN